MPTIPTATDASEELEPNGEPSAQQNAAGDNLAHFRMRFKT